jgi:hypothetical protein
MRKDERSKTFRGKGDMMRTPRCRRWCKMALPQICRVPRYERAPGLTVSQSGNPVLGSRLNPGE